MKVEWTNRDNLSIETTSQNSKAILVLDKMPNSCEECIVRCDGYTAKEYAQRTIIKPNWCPLRPLPEKLKLRIQTEWLGDYDRYEIGYNACIDDINRRNRMTLEEIAKGIGYKECRNCEHQIAPLRSCEWAERGGDGIVHIICPMWEKRIETGETE